MALDAALASVLLIPFDTLAHTLWISGPLYLMSGALVVPLPPPELVGALCAMILFLYPTCISIASETVSSALFICSGVSFGCNTPVSSSSSFISNFSCSALYSSVSNSVLFISANFMPDAMRCSSSNSFSLSLV